MSLPDINLLDLMGIEYRRSRWALYGNLLFGMSITALVLVDILSAHRVSLWLAPTAFIFQAVVLVLKHISSTHYSRGEEIRRLAVLKDGLGIQPDPKIMAKIAARNLGVTPPKRVHIGKYFASAEPSSTLRLLENIEESSFWTHNIASFASKIGFVIVLVGGAICFLALWMLIDSGASQNIHKDAEAMIVILGFIVSGDFLMLSLEYRRLSQEACHRMEDAGNQINVASNDRDAAMLIFGEYNCNLSSASPLPKVIYDFLNTRLSSAWALRKTNISVE